jgi:hypothetical protein
MNLPLQRKALVNPALIGCSPPLSVHPAFREPPAKGQEAAEAPDFDGVLSGTGQTLFSGRTTSLECRGRDLIQSCCRSTVRAARIAKRG